MKKEQKRTPSPLDAPSCTPVRQISTGKVGLIGVDPYQIRGPGEIIVTFENAKSENALLGHASPHTDFEVISPTEMTPYQRQKYGIKLRKKKKQEGY